MAFTDSKNNFMNKASALLLAGTTLAATAIPFQYAAAEPAAEQKITHTEKVVFSDFEKLTVIKKIGTNENRATAEKLASDITKEINSVIPKAQTRYVAGELSDDPEGSIIFKAFDQKLFEISKAKYDELLEKGLTEKLSRGISLRYSRLAVPYFQNQKQEKINEIKSRLAPN